MKRIQRRIKQKHNQLLCNAHQNDLTLGFYIELQQRINESKRNQRLARRYGETADWENAESDDVFGIIVPMILNVKKRNC